MDNTLTIEASVSPDGKLVVFIAFPRGQAVQCSITREVLEQYFWAPISASDARPLKAYMDGQKRIVAANLASSSVDGCRLPSSSKCASSAVEAAYTSRAAPTPRSRASASCDSVFSFAKGRDEITSPEHRSRRHTGR
ncbi:DUF1488 family protein [Paraburkholderia sp. 1N]|uniref:DUF1488 family protein n=1 Tax=Paraburkholderia solitsugae TaxID=2675748 RepID=A0ABX2BL30_9BURK|nr:DUF1488 family protein [Paraburkholderia solitsugae]